MWTKEASELTHGRPRVVEGKMIPFEVYGVKAISMGFLIDPDKPMILRGPMLHSAMQQFLRSFPDMRVTTPYPIQFGSGDWITVVTRATGTFTGDMVLPDGKVIAPTGKAFDVEFGQTVNWDGDLLVEISSFWDAALQARQIGLGK